MTTLQTQRNAYLKGFADGAESVSRWISVSDQMPKDPGQYIIYRKRVKESVRAAYCRLVDDRMYFFCPSGPIDTDVLFWQHMPLPPKENE